MDKNRHSKKITYILSLFVVIVFIAYYFVFIDIKSKNENISILTHDLQLQVKRQQYMDSMQKIVSNANSDIGQIDDSIVSTDGNVQFIEDLESTAKNNGLSITIDSLGLENSPVLDKAQMTILRVKAKTKGSWTGTYKFLAELESLPQKIKINNFGFVNEVDEKSTNSSSGWQSQFEIQILKYK